MISVIVPVYNIENVIGKCLDSILGQTYRHLQVIVVDDGSTDNSGKICDVYAHKDNRIQVIHIENRGPAGARKKGLSYARGEYVGFVDGDDWIQPWMYEELLMEMEAADADFVHFGYWEENNGVIIPHLKFEEGVFDISGKTTAFIRRFVLRETYSGYESMTCSIWSKLFRRDIICEAFAKVPDFLKVGEDLAAVCFCVMQSRRVVLRKKAFYQYQVGRESASHKGSGADKLMERVTIYNFLRSLFIQFNCLGEMEKSLNTYLSLQIYSCLQEDAAPNIRLPFFQIAPIGKLYGYKLVLYGAGGVGQDYYLQIRKHMQCDLVAWADRDYQNIKFDYAQLVGLEEVRKLRYDIILIAVEKASLAEEIRTELVSQGIMPDKIRWIPPTYIYA